jgi:hypothetical protein
MAGGVKLVNGEVDFRNLPVILQLIFTRRVYDSSWTLSIDTGYNSLMDTGEKL